MFTHWGIALDWWLPLTATLSAIAVLAAIAWLHWRAGRRGAGQSRGLVWAYAVAALLWLGYGLYFMVRRFGGGDALQLFAQQPELQRLPLIIGAIAWCAALLVARLLALGGPGRS